jgi:hypothetical protein
MNWRTISTTLAATVLLTTSRGRAEEPSPKEVFVRRILPIYEAREASSCVQCHLAGVDLKNYILPTHEKTFRSLRDQNLIDLDRPEASKILRLIDMGGKDTTTTRPFEKKRQAEHDAFAAWIRACGTDRSLRELPPLAGRELAAPPRPVEVIRHARKDRLLESFERNIWAMRFRCMGCHNEGTPQCDKLVKEHGPRVAWMKKAGAEATMSYLLGRPTLVNVKEPAKSLLMRKPLNEVKHEGGQKFLPGDQGYKAYRTWIDDYARLKNDGYKTAAELPASGAGLKRFGTNHWLKLTDTPPAWGDKLLQVNLFAWDPAKEAWEPTPIATSDRGVWGKGRLWQNNLLLLAPAGSKRANAWSKGTSSLPPGRYLVKVYVDAEGKVAKDWKASLTEADYVGQAEVRSNWPSGYGNMTTLKATTVRAGR